MATGAHRHQHSGLSRSLPTIGKCSYTERESLHSKCQSEPKLFFSFSLYLCFLSDPSSSSRCSSRVPSSSPRLLRQYLPHSKSPSYEPSCSPCLTSVTAVSTAPGLQPSRNNSALVFNPWTSIRPLCPPLVFIYFFLPLFSSREEVLIY